jgi:ribonuclease P protein component
MDPFYTLKNNSDFLRVYSKGKSFVNPILVTYILKNRKRVVRFGITTSKKTGNAVKRNKSRRLIRESFRFLSSKVTPGFDFVFVARSKTPFLKSTDILRVMEQQLNRAGVLK